uniref:Uncharacterized protein n=1 Tax=Phlebotomus papatasi TaxID=29031 RepID=A0A1B0DFT3_PHLPP
MPRASRNRSGEARMEEELCEMRRENMDLREELARLRREAAERPPRDLSGISSYLGGTWRMSGREAQYAIPKFYPPNDPCNPAKWIEDIEILMVANGWESQQTRFYASTRLRGASEKWYLARHREVQDWDAFKNGVLQAFPETNDFGQIHERLMNRKRKASESLEDYVYDVQRMAMSANMNDNQIRKYVLSGLNDPQLRGMVPISCDASIPDLLKDLREGEIILKDSRKTRMEVTGGQYLKNPPASLSDQSGERAAFSSAKEREGKNKPDKKIIICYKCNNRGHIARNCPMKSDFRLPVMEQVVTQNEFQKPVMINGKEADAFLDLGADCSVIRESCARDIHLQTKRCDVNLKGFGNGLAKATEKVCADVQWDGVKEKTTLYVIPDQALDIDVLLGRDFVDKPGLELVKRFGTCEVKRLNRVSKMQGLSTEEREPIPPEMIQVNQEIPKQFQEKKIRHAQGEKYNSCHLAPEQYHEGDLVLIRVDHPATGSSRKLLTRFKGPYVVSKVLGADRYEVRDSETVRLTRKPFVSVQCSERMKRWPDLINFDISEISYVDDCEDSTETCDNTRINDIMVRQGLFCIWQTTIRQDLADKNIVRDLAAGNLFEIWRTKTLFEI